MVQDTCLESSPSSLPGVIGSSTTAAVVSMCLFPSFHCLANQPPYVVQKRLSPDCFCSFCIFVSLMLAVCAAYFTAGCSSSSPPCAFPSDVHIARSRAMLCFFFLVSGIVRCGFASHSYTPTCIHAATHPIRSACRSSSASSHPRRATSASRRSARLSTARICCGP